MLEIVPLANNSIIFFPVEGRKDKCESLDGPPPARSNEVILRGSAWPLHPVVAEKRERSHSTFMKMALSLLGHVRLESKNTPEVICLAYYNQYFLPASAYRAAPRWNAASLREFTQARGSGVSAGVRCEASERSGIGQEDQSEGATPQPVHQGRGPHHHEWRREAACRVYVDLNRTPPVGVWRVRSSPAGLHPCAGGGVGNWRVWKRSRTGIIVPAYVSQHGAARLACSGSFSGNAAGRKSVRSSDSPVLPRRLPAITGPPQGGWRSS